MRFKRRSDSPLHKKARRGFRGYPVATVAFYGPDDQFATKVAVGIVPGEDAEPTALNRWLSGTQDVRFDPAIGAQILKFIDDNQAKSVVVTSGIIGCPHEEGVDYPEGSDCPQCSFWTGRDRWAGKPIG